MNKVRIFKISGKRIGRVMVFLSLAVISLTGLFGQSHRQDSIVFPSMKGYGIVYNYPVYHSDNLWDYIDGAADNYLSYHFQELHIAEYVKGRKIFFKVEIYHHESPLYAFGIYSSERSPVYQFIPLGVQGFREESLINFLKGSYYVKILTQQKGKRVENDLKELAGKVEAILPGAATFPAELRLFPEEGKVRNAERFTAENFLGHEFFDSVFTAEYKTNDVSFTIFLTRRANVENARSLMGNFYKAATGKIPDVLHEGDQMIEDGYNGKIYIIWEGNVIFGFQNMTNQNLMRNLAREMLNKLQQTHLH